MKKILFYAPSSFGINEVLIKKLSFLGYEVTQVPHRSNVKLSFFIKAVLFLLNFIINIKPYREKKLQQEQEKAFRRMIKSIKNPLDYGLIIRPDHFSVEDLKKIKNKVNKLIGYQWDGLDRYSDVHEKIQCFDRFFVFDEQDALRYPNTIHTTNFYCDLPFEDKCREYDISFVGSIFDDRLEKATNIAKWCKENNISYKFHCIQYSMNKELDKNFRKYQISKLPISFEENSKLIQRSKAIIDFKNTVHDGFSFRVFEALGYGTKLITDNPHIVREKFYHPNNVLITKDFNFNQIIEFLDKPYVPMSEDIRNYYSFSSWLRRILGETGK